MSEFRLTLRSADFNNGEMDVIKTLFEYLAALRADIAALQCALDFSVLERLDELEGRLDEI